MRTCRNITNRLFLYAKNYLFDRRSNMLKFKNARRFFAGFAAVVLMTALLTGAVAESYKATVIVDNMIVREGASLSSKKLGTLARGRVVTVLDRKDNIAKINYNGNIGYALLTSLERADEVYEVISTTARVFTKADDSSKVIATVKKGYKVTVTAIDLSGKWAKVRNGSKVGFMKMGVLKVTDDVVSAEPVTTEEKASIAKTMYINKDGVKIFSKMNKSSKVIATVKKGYSLTVTATSGEWAKVKNGSKVGYVLLSRLSETKPAGPTLEPNMAKSATVTKKINVFKNMNGDKKTGTLAKNAKVTVLAVSGDWALIELNSKRGYVKKAYLQLIEIPQVLFTATVIAAGTTVYKTASTSGKKAGTLKRGDSADVCEYNDTWAKILSGDTVLYVLKDDLWKDSYSALKSGSSGEAVKKLQTALEALGYMDSAPDGDYGTNTVEAVKRAQTALGMSADGEASNLFQQVLYGGKAPASDILSVQMKNGSVGTNVTRLQTRLNAKNYFAATIDGEYGEITAAAVKLFQKTNGLTQTGTADSATLKLLFSSDAIRNTGSPISRVESNTAPSTGKWTEDYSRSDPAQGTATDLIENVIALGLTKLGCKYVYATANGTTFDCSGFVSYCYGKYNVSLARSAYSIGYGKGTKITAISELRRGDVICFNTNESDNDLSDHVGIYLGNYQFIHASSSAGKVVISQLKDGFYNRVFSWARRVV